MEYKIGQVFEFKGKWYQFVEVNGTCCNNCALNKGLKCINPDISTQCARFFRTDGKNGHVVLLDAIGGEYKQGNAIFRDYRCQTKPVTTDKRVYISHTDSDIGLIISVRLTENDDLNLIERKIGEIFEHNGEWYQCIENIDCENCAFNAIVCDEIDDIVGPCSTDLRCDGKSVVFKRLEKVGEPYADYCPSGRVIYFQRYKCYQKPIYNGDFICWSDDISISIEIKNKEDMEENNNAKHSNSENIGKNLKPFDLQAAKSGKPVCTRDGKKARIICFDRVTNSTNEYTGHLIVLVTNPNGDEQSFYYTEKGNLAGEDEYDNHKWDLMMLPEKKEGWVNVSKFRTYASKEEALSHKTYDIIDTIKVSWEE